jgi:hypothetical protein
VGAPGLHLLQSSLQLYLDLIDLIQHMRIQQLLSLNTQNRSELHDLDLKPTPSVRHHSCSPHNYLSSSSEVHSPAYDQQLVVFQCEQPLLTSTTLTVIHGALTLPSLPPLRLIGLPSSIALWIPYSTANPHLAYNNKIQLAPAGAQPRSVR